MTQADQTAADAADRRPAPAWVFASLALCMLLPSLGTSIANVALPTLAEAFDATFEQVRWVVLAYLLTTTALIVGAGRLGDLLGHRRMLMVGLALFTLASGLSGVAPDLGWLIAARALQGLGAALMMALTMAFVGEAVPKARTGSAMGLLGAMSAAGTALGPTLGGLLIAALGWRAIFLVSVPLGLLTLLLVLRCLPADPAAPTGAWRLRFDGLGWLTLFRQRRLTASLAMSALVSTVMMATLVVGPFYLARALGLGMALVGLVMSAGPVVATLAGVPAGRLVDRLGTQATTVGGLLGMMAGCVALASVPSAWGIAGFVAPIALTTAGYALFQAANNSAVMRDVAAGRRGVISGLLNLARNLGLISGASVMGVVFTLAAGADATVAGPAAVAAGMRVTFAVAAALLLVGLLIAQGSRALQRRSTESDPMGHARDLPPC
nr:MFS transporter [uncultured Roseateles sp.]